MIEERTLSVELGDAFRAVQGRMRGQRSPILGLEGQGLVERFVSSETLLLDAIGALGLAYVQVRRIRRALHPSALFALRKGLRQPRCYIGQHPNLGVSKQWITDRRFFEVTRVSHQRYECRMGELNEHGNYDHRHFNRRIFWGWDTVRKEAESWLLK